MNTDKVTSVFGGLYGADQLYQYGNLLLSTCDKCGFSIENIVHFIAAIGVCVWAYFTNKQN
jgi:hypothetical protein